ncbi:MAG: thioredoxin family protein [Candidatus Hydrogenedentes bacterium]|jgi:small redox-active disulfide protein 2|nr:thioredoxin family protein [Candidatus Hydrogenedentota bacterium]
MDIKIYGTGCSKCHKLADNAAAALEESGIVGKVEKITEMAAITAAGVMMTPALTMNGKKRSSGRVLTKDEILKMIIEESGTDPDNPY